MQTPLTFAALKSRAGLSRQRLVGFGLLALLSAATVWLGQTGLASGHRNTAAGGAAPSQKGGALPSVADILNPDGTLRAGVSGSFDPRGFNMKLGAGGAPRFVPQAACADKWDDRFAVPGANALDYEALVFALAVDGSGNVYVGGRFATVGNMLANHIARWDGTNWAALAHTGLDNDVYALTVSGNNLFVGGNFSRTADSAVTNLNNIARYDLSNNTWAALAHNGLNSYVYTLAVSGNTLFVGGFDFTQTADGAVTNLNRIARYDIVNNAWAPLAHNGLNGAVYTLAVSGNNLFVGGGYTQTADGAVTNLNYIARYDLSNNTWAPLAHNGLGGEYPFVTVLAVSGNTLFVGGFFERTADGAVTNLNNIARYDLINNAWAGLDNGLNGSANAIAATASRLYVGGYFNRAGCQPSHKFAIYFLTNAPTISAVATTRQQGSPASNSQIAAVSAAEQAANTLAVTVNGGTSATVNGVTISNITVTAAGVVNANIATAANATTANFTLRVTESGGLFAEATLTVAVVKFSGSIADPLVCTGNVVSVTLVLANTGAAPLTVNNTTTFTNLVGVPGSCTATPNVGTCTVTNANLTYTATLAANQTVTLSYSAQVADGTPNGAQICSNNSASFGGGPPLSLVVCNTLNCPTPGPGLSLPATAEVSDQRPGSVLVYNLYSSSISAPNAQNSRIAITNTHPTRPVAVHLFFVDGATCSIADSLVCLTAQQTASFLASDIDPGTTGYIVAVASDAVTGCPINFNFLIGDAYVKLSSGHAANLAAEGFAALAGGLPACDANSVTTILNFDGVSYNRAPRTLAASNIPSRGDGNDTLLVLNRLGGSLVTGAATLTNLFGILYDDAENPLSFNFSPGVCQFRSSLSNNFPRIAPRFDQFIPAGRSGWAKFYSTSEIGLLGAQLNYNPNAETAANAFNQGHNLHKLMLTQSVQLTIPIFPPNC
jgi:hypothetical protein